MALPASALEPVSPGATVDRTPAWPAHHVIAFGVMLAALVAVPFVRQIYPVFVMKALCFALFACAFNLLIGYVGLLSFGHAAFLGAAGYATAHS
ncbi:MAG: branched-chain amino acid ABC transporter permease, partial [Microvirga sp.]